MKRCVCFDRSFEDVRRLCGEHGWRTVEEIARSLGCSTQCGLCGPYLERMLATGQTAFPSAPSAERDASRTRVLLSWSSGKDSAWALHTLRQDSGLEVVGLFTTLNGAFDRVAMHAVRRELVEAQADSAGLPLVQARLPWPCSNTEYERISAAAIKPARNELRFTHMAFGDLFLEDVRSYREARMRELGLTPLFPLWGLDTARLGREMIRRGVRARITCVDRRVLPVSFAGREYDDALLDELPPGVDPCAERGEFHTFAWKGPMFRRPIDILPGEVVERDGFIFADLLPCDSHSNTTGA